MVSERLFAAVPADHPASVSVGHWSDAVRRTGCTVIGFDRAVPAVVDVRGGAPGTRETDLLASGATVRAVDAIVFTGGSALGLGCADGVVRALREGGRGVQTPAGPVPTVPAAVIFDLTVGEPAFPEAEHGRIALAAAVPIGRAERGRVGAGTGATVEKLAPGRTRPGGLGIAHIDVPGVGSVWAVAVVNALGWIRSQTAEVDPRLALIAAAPVPLPSPRTATTLMAVIVDADASYVTLERCAIAAHDGLARAIVPAHTMYDGDIAFAAGLRATTDVAADAVRLALAAEVAVERAVYDAVDNGER